MIIFDLDGTLADCEHRRHFVDPEKNKYYERTNIYRNKINGRIQGHDRERWIDVRDVDVEFRSDYKAFYEACDKDKPIMPVIEIMLTCSLPYEIWSGRCESVRDKTERWLCQFMHPSELPEIKMRPIGDNTPDDELKERWLNERCSDLITAQIEGKNAVRHDIKFVFDDRPNVVRMWRSHGIFVFNCCQHDMEF
jgi:hypothetical protein